MAFIGVVAQAALGCDGGASSKGSPDSGEVALDASGPTDGSAGPHDVADATHRIDDAALTPQVHEQALDARVHAADDGGASATDARPSGNADAASALIPDAAAPSCGGLGQACCSDSCNAGLACLNGASCSCSKALFGRYLLRTDGLLLYESDYPATTETPVLDATTALPLAGVTAAAEGYQHGCALIGASQTVSCWRTSATGNSLGQLGNGTTDTMGVTFRATSVLKAANQPLTNVVSLSTQSGALATSTCAETSDGKLYCWGDVTWLVNGGVKLANAYAISITTDGVAPFSGALQTSLNDTYGCSIVHGDAANELWCWGRNNHGQLATGDTTTKRYPTKVLGLVNPTKVVTFGSDEYGAASCVIDETKVKCWGSNDTGQLGEGTKNSPVLSPTSVTLMGGSAAIDGVVDLAGGYEDNIRSNACAELSDHTLLCWGNQFQSYPTVYGLNNIAILGSVERGVVRLLTSDGVYHMNTKTRTPNCGVLQ